MKLNKHHLLLLLFLLGATLHAQVKNITGRVIDAKERNPISFVPIVVKTSPPTEPPQVVMTDLDGKFQLQAKEGDVLEIAFMGYEKQYKKIEGKAKKKHFKIVLEESVGTVCYGPMSILFYTSLERRKEEETFTYPQQSIGEQELTEVKQMNFLNSLEGRIAGVQLQHEALEIRGGNKVRYIVDGVPIDNPSDLNPEDIRSLTVLPGTQAAAIYGASAANGVVLICTKKSTSKKLNVNFSSSAELLKPLSSEDIYRTGYVYQNAVSFSGGQNFKKGAKNRIYASLASLESTSIVPNDSYNRYNSYLHNATSLLNDKLNIDLSANYIHQYERTPSGYHNQYTEMKDRYMFLAKANYVVGRGLSFTGHFRMDNNLITAHSTYKQQYADIILGYHKKILPKFNLETHLGALYDESNTQAAFAITEVDWQSKVFFTLSGRLEKSLNRLYINKTIFTPSISMAMLLHQFLDIDKSTLSYAKLRTGYTQITDSYNWQSERSMCYEIGLDTKWLFDCLSAGVTFYRNQINKQGVELVLGYISEKPNPYPKTPGFYWETQLVAATYPHTQLGWRGKMNYNDFDLNFLFKTRSGEKVCLQEAALTYHFKGKFEMKGLNDLSMSLIATYDVDSPKYTSLPLVRSYGLSVRMQF
ncbi:TonB-dependent receptor plug domain-containing protein [Capnocytophaga genosp. AHN8471]|uniref:TonB-dependent receptor plug domain-containing protein n=1 Tax=Capnocytophaga genosp. AHN8471 TaxID=327574 RepID=A0ABS1YTT5_9FLAO|nr:carboxypeptidase-like regulatory domain-containing protein [Capnocytophaga genosp. AHN8471]MBM0649824.1 TonB-dependent receptor plug domain-containing protein [Capnocytophaga genosp. AHN8471]MBM0662444.1 TonB-dependent receptor plug domain-containing protein [Capnocytophaga genosp. AHN8471]